MQLPQGMYLQPHGSSNTPNGIEMLTVGQGRNMYQCVEAIERMSIPVPSLKRKWDEENEERPTKRISYQEQPEHTHHTTEQRPNTPLTSGLSVPMTGMYRPTNGHIPSPQQRTPASEPPKKRGRPSRADRAKKDLRPLLPQPPASAPAPPPPRPMSSHAQSPAGLRPLQPALLPALKMNTPRSITPPGAYAPAARQVRSPPATSPESRAQGSPSDGALHPALCKAEGPAGLPDSSNLRVLVE